MRYLVPKFINREARVWGQLTFKEVLVMGGLLLFSIVLWYIIPPTIFILVVPAGAILVVALLFFKVKGRTLLSVVTSYIWYLFSPKVYVWQRKKFSPQIITSPTPKRTTQKPISSTPSLRIVDRGHLKDLYNKINLRAVNIKGTKDNG